MRRYQEEYIENCRKFRSVMSEPIPRGGDPETYYDEYLNKKQEALDLINKNTLLLQSRLLPVLDDLHTQDIETLAELESFADALTAAPLSLDAALACQIHESILSCYRHLNRREDIIRELYKLGMSRYGLWMTLTALDKVPEAEGFSSRMRYCFVEASSYIKFFDEFSEETQAYILRSYANTYLGDFKDWKEKYYRVKKTLQVFTDERYHISAPNLPWELYIHTAHRQMSSVMPYNFPEGPPSPEIVTDVLESALIIYEKQLEEAKESGGSAHAHQLLPYYSMEYNCGILKIEELLAHMEELMNSGDTSDYDDNNNYRIISLPAYYVQYIYQSPELFTPRNDYIAGLYRRMLDYIKNMPQDKLTDRTRLYLRYDLACFYEAQGGISYKEMALEIMRRFAPELYIHGYTVGLAAKAVCATIMENEPDQFDDIPRIAKLSSADEKRAEMEEMAFGAGLLHDIGKLYLSAFYEHAGRQMLASEDEAMELHTIVGYLRLKEFASCADYADAAYGHHCWYDGGSGYPAGFVRKKSPYRVLVDLIAFADFIDSDDEEENSQMSLRTMTFDEKIAKAKKLEGHRFSPLVTSWLRTPALLDRLRKIYADGRREALRDLMQPCPEDPEKNI